MIHSQPQWLPNCADQVHRLDDACHEGEGPQNEFERWLVHLSAV